MNAVLSLLTLILFTMFIVDMYISWSLEIVKYVKVHTCHVICWHLWLWPRGKWLDIGTVALLGCNQIFHMYQKYQNKNLSKCNNLLQKDTDFGGTDRHVLCLKPADCRCVWILTSNTIINSCYLWLLPRVTCTWLLATVDLFVHNNIFHISVISPWKLSVVLYCTGMCGMF